jgi:hypothetical protein
LKSDDYITMTLNIFIRKTTRSGVTYSLQPEWYDLLSPSISDTAIANTSSSANVTSGSSNRTLLERLLQWASFPVVGQDSDYQVGFQLAGIEIVISMLVADGLSRVGWQSHRETWQFFPPWAYSKWDKTIENLARTMVCIGDPVETFSLPSILLDNKSTRLMMRAKFTGYVMAATGWFDYLAVAIILLHALIATIHTGRSTW